MAATTDNLYDCFSLILVCCITVVIQTSSQPSSAKTIIITPRNKSESNQPLSQLKILSFGKAIDEYSYKLLGKGVMVQSVNVVTKILVKFLVLFIKMGLNFLGYIIILAVVEFE